jgi:hypothetical protein
MEEHPLQQTINPSGPTIVTPIPTGPPREPDASVVAKQDPSHTEVDFLDDLARATRPVDSPS